MRKASNFGELDFRSLQHIPDLAIDLQYATGKYNLQPYRSAHKPVTVRQIRNFGGANPWRLRFQRLGNVNVHMVSNPCFGVTRRSAIRHLSRRRWRGRSAHSLLAEAFLTPSGINAEYCDLQRTVLGRSTFRRTRIIKVTFQRAQMPDLHGDIWRVHSLKTLRRRG